jgi:hypothetical protein
MRRACVALPALLGKFGNERKMSSFMEFASGNKCFELVNEGYAGFQQATAEKFVV